MGILARLRLAKIRTMARPNSPDMPPKRTKKQPRSQDLSLPAPQSERRETLVGSGHVPPGQIRTQGRGPLMSSILSRCRLSISKRGYHSHAPTAIKRVMFYSSLQAAVSKSIYSNINFKVKQAVCLEIVSYKL